MPTSVRYGINAPSVVSEVIDGEAVIMNLESGAYFSARGVAATIWEQIIAGESVSRVGDFVARRWTAASAASDVETFVASLLEHALVVALPAEESPAAGRPAAIPSDDAHAPPYAPPVLEVFNDMKDMLLLDPIHDVGEAGWPMPAAADGTDRRT